MEKKVEGGVVVGYTEEKKEEPKEAPVKKTKKK